MIGWWASTARLVLIEARRPLVRRGETQFAPSGGWSVATTIYQLAPVAVVERTRWHLDQKTTARTGKEEGTASGRPARRVAARARRSGARWTFRGLATVWARLGNRDDRRDADRRGTRAGAASRTQSGPRLGAPRGRLAGDLARRNDRGDPRVGRRSVAASSAAWSRERDEQSSVTTQDIVLGVHGSPGEPRISAKLTPSGRTRNRRCARISWLSSPSRRRAWR
jgi:hypothetical protein